MENNINRLKTAIAKTTEQLQKVTRTKFGGRFCSIQIQSLRRKLVALQRGDLKRPKTTIHQRNIKKLSGIQPKMSNNRIKQQQARQLGTAASPVSRAVAQQPHKAPQPIEQMIQNLPEPPKEASVPKNHYDFEQAIQLNKTQLKALAKQLQGNNAHRFMRDLTCGAFDQHFKGDIALSNQIKIELQGKVRNGMALSVDKANRLKTLLLKDSLSQASVDRIERMLANIELLPEKRRSELESLIQIKRNQRQQ